MSRLRLRTRMTLSGRRALVTGATSGIGEACAWRLAADGADLALVARGGDALAATAKAIESAHGVRVETAVLDVRDLDAVRRLDRERPSIIREADVLVNNAGLARGIETIQEGRTDDWDEMIDTNVKGLLYVTRHVLPHMIARGRGHVVNVGSTAGHWVYRGGAVYCATKHAVAAITEAMRLDVHGSGVRVTAVEPGLVETRFSVVRFHGDEARAKGVYAGLTPLTAADVADAVHWCVTRPPHVNVQDVIMTPTDQSSVRDLHRRTSA